MDELDPGVHGSQALLSGPKREADLMHFSMTPAACFWLWLLKKPLEWSGLEF